MATHALLLGCPGTPFDLLFAFFSFAPQIFLAAMVVALVVAAVPRRGTR